MSQPSAQQRPSLPWWRVFLLNTSVIAAALLAGAVSCEVALRVIYARSLDFSMEMWKYAVALKRSSPNPRLSFAHVPNGSAFLMGVQMTTNSHGLRDREYPEARPDGVYRIVMLGDSTTLGWGVPEDQTIPKILERQLNASPAASGHRFEVLNAGVGNYGTVQEVEHYHTIDRAYHPNLIILQYFINDAEPVPTERRPWLLGRWYLPAFAVARFDGMLRLAGRRPGWQQYYSELYQEGNRAGLVAAEDALGRLARMAEEDRAALLVTLLPELRTLNGEYPFAREHRIIQSTLARYGIPSLELIDGLRGRGPESDLWVTPADPHPNARANALIVAQLLPWVLQRAAPAE